MPMILTPRVQYLAQLLQETLANIQILLVKQRYLQHKFLAPQLQADSAFFERTTGTFIEVTNLSGTTITGDYGQFLNLTGFRSHATSFSGTTITGDVASLAVTLRNFWFLYLLHQAQLLLVPLVYLPALEAQTLTAANLQFSGDQTVSGSFTVLENLFISGSGYFASGISVTGEVSGEVITAQSGTFDTIITAPTITGGTISGDNVYVSGTITGTTIATTSGHFVTATGTSAEFTTFSGASGVFTNVTGTSFLRYDDQCTNWNFCFWYCLKTFNYF